MLKNWIHIFIYNIKHSKLFTLLNILGLSIGIAGVIFAILYWNDENSYNAWNPEKDVVYQVINDMGERDALTQYWNTNVVPLAPILMDRAKAVKEFCYADDYYEEEILNYNGKKEIVKVLDVQSNFFDFFPFEFIKGTPQSALANNTCIAISENTAHLLFGDQDPIGKQLKYTDKMLTVRGVYRIPGNSSYHPDAVTNLIETLMEENRSEWGNFSFNLFLKINDKTSLPKIEKLVEDIYFEYRIKPTATKLGMTIEEFKKKYGQIKPMLEPLKTARLFSVANGYPEGRGNLKMLLIIVGLSVFILVLAIINYINMATANAIKRAKEVGVRKITGATKGNIVLQFVFETSMVVVLSILLSLVLVETALPFYNEFLDKTLVLNSSQFFLQLGYLFVLLIILAGVFPAVYVANFETIKVLKGNYGRSKSGIWLRNTMLVLQFAIASFFIVASYIVYSQVNYMSNKDTGFNGEQVVVIDYRNPYNWQEEGFRKKLLNKYNVIKQELGKIDGVRKVSTGSFTFDHGANSSSGFEHKGVEIQADNMGVDFDMLQMMDVKLKEGRFLSAEFASDTINSMMVNETAARLLNEPHVIGTEIDWRKEKRLKIVGVVKDFHTQGPQSEIPPMIFVHFKTVDWMVLNVSGIYMKIDASKVDKVLSDTEKFWTTHVDTEYPFTYDFVDKKFARTYAQYTNQKNLFSTLNIVVVIIALFGLFALASYSMERRMKEIAVRKTLGAETSRLLSMLSVQYVVYCVIGFLLAVFPVYYLLSIWLEDFAYRISISAWPFVTGFVVLLLLTLLVVLGKAWQATRVDVLKYLKYE